MYYIDNFALTILIYFLIGNENLVLDYNDEDSLEDLKNYILTINLAVEENSKSKTKMQAPLLKYTIDKFLTKITITYENKCYLIDYLEKYIECYKNDELEDSMKINTFERFDCLQEDLIQEVENSKTSRKRYLLKKLKYAPIVLATYIENNKFIRDLNIVILDSEDAPYPIRIFDYITSDKDEWYGVYKNWQDNYFEYSYELDMEWYLNKDEEPKVDTKEVKKKTKKKTTKKRKSVYNIPRQSWRIYIVITTDETILQNIKNNISTFEKNLLKKYEICDVDGPTTYDTAISRFNSDIKKFLPSSYKDIDLITTSNFGSNYYDVNMNLIKEFAVLVKNHEEMIVKYKKYLPSVEEYRKNK